jgi:hypothetical protein
VIYLFWNKSLFFITKVFLHINFCTALSCLVCASDLPSFIFVFLSICLHYIPKNRLFNGFCLIRHRWTGRYEAHLWDNSCKKEGQSRKGRQG